MRSFLTELRRRDVFRVGVAYLVSAWLIIQIVDTVAPPLGLPEWVLPMAIWLGVAGFPVAIFVAWVFELTPSGVVRTEDAQPDEVIPTRGATQFNVLIVGLMAAVIGVLLVDRFWMQSHLRVVDDSLLKRESVAVMPFVNLSEDPQNEFFADGLAEELLNSLAQVEGLKVTARTSTFFFKDKNPSISEVAEALDVDTIVEGSVRRSGDTIRIGVNLISVDDSSNLWSDQYDRPMGDLFAVQDEIANEIIARLMPHLQGIEQPRVVSNNRDIAPDIYERFLLSRQRYHDGMTESLALARDGFRSVTESAPNYAPAWSWLARCWIDSAGREGIDPDEALVAAEEAIDKALTLDPSQPMAFVARGDVLYRDDQFEAALDSYDRAIAHKSDLVDAYIARQDVLVRLEQPNAAILALQQARVIDPLHTEVLEGLAHLQNLQGQRRGAIESVETLWLVNPTAAARLEVHLYGDSGDYASAIYLAKKFGTASVGELAYWSVILGLHDEPVILESSYRPVSLAVQGRRDEALYELAIVKREESDEHFRSDMEFMTMVVLEEYVTAKDLLWERWLSQQTDNPGADLRVPDLFALAGLMLKLDDTERIGPVVRALQDDVSKLGPLHAGSYHFLNGMTDLVSNEIDDAANHFKSLAESGDGGMSMYGTALPLSWLFEGNSQLQSVYEQFVDNRNQQIDRLMRFRSENMTPAEVREEYIAAGAARALKE